MVYVSASMVYPCLLGLRGRGHTAGESEDDLLAHLERIGHIYEVPTIAVT